MSTKKNIIADNSTSQEESLELRIAKAVSLNKKTSERIVGLTSIDYEFNSIKYRGTTIRPVSITPLERAIVGIVNIDKSGSLSSIGQILGLDVEHDMAEKAMLLESINKMKDYGVIEGDESFFALTEKGKVFANEGERPETYSKDFTIFYDANHPTYKSLSIDLAKAKVQKLDKQEPAPSLAFEQIKDIAEVQAPSVQSAKNRYILRSATLIQAEKLHTQIHIAFLQSIRNEDEIRAIAFEGAQNILLPNFSDLINNEEKWLNELLAQCIDKSLQKNIEEGGWELVSKSLEKDSEQKAIEADVVDRENEELEGNKPESDNELERLHKRALYDQTSFELELENIFTKDNPDEVWLVSPWVKRAFIQKRVPQFIPLLDAGKRIFIAYSQAEFDSRGSMSEMITPQAEEEIKKLDKKYHNFYYVELPPFHTKHVIEVKNGQSVLFNGSFNVLSFEALNYRGKVRREEMALVHHQVATSKHQYYIDVFSDIYIKREIEHIRKMDQKELSNYDKRRMEYLMSICSNKEAFVDFFSELDERQLNALNAVWYDQYEKVLEEVQKYKDLNVIDSDQYKKLNSTIANLIKQCVTLTISEDAVLKLNENYDILNNIPRNKTSKKNKNKTEPSKPASDDSLIRVNAEITVSNADFASADTITLYLASLYYLYVNRFFGTISKAFKPLDKLLKNKDAMDKVLAFNVAENTRNNEMLDITIMVGGLSFKFWSIANKMQLDRLEKLNKTAEKGKRFTIISARDIENKLKQLMK